LIDATQNQDALVEVSGILRAHAANLVKVARDLRLMSTVRGGTRRDRIAGDTAGSSIMPEGDPVIPEMGTQVAFRVMAHDQESSAWVVMSGRAGT